MFSISRLYNSACSNATIPIRIYSIMMSIIFHHYKTLTKNNIVSTAPNKHKGDNNYNSIILQKELDKWKTYSDILRKPNRNLLNQMLQSTYKYSNAIDDKGEQFSTVSLIMSILFEQQYKIKSEIIHLCYSLYF